MSLTVQGETYRTRDELADTIDRLTTELGAMPSDTPGHASLARHIERLQEALTELEGDSSPDRGEASGAAADVAVAAPDVVRESGGEDEDDEPPPEEDEAYAPDNVCPVCRGAGTLPIEPPLDPRTEACPRCSGFGKVFTGSMVEGHEMRDCPECQGNGYVDKREPFAPPDRPTVVTHSAWPDAFRDDSTGLWKPGYGSVPPWSGAQWDPYEAKWT